MPNFYAKTTFFLRCSEVSKNSVTRKNPFGRHISLDPEPQFTEAQYPVFEAQVPFSKEQVPHSKEHVPLCEEQVPLSEAQVPLSEGQVPSLKHKCLLLRHKCLPLRQKCHLLRCIFMMQLELLLSNIIYSHFYRTILINVFSRHILSKI